MPSQESMVFHLTHLGATPEDLKKIKNLERVSKHIRHSFSGIAIKHTWQMLLLDEVEFNPQEQASAFWLESDTNGNKPIHYLSVSGNMAALQWIASTQPGLLDTKDKFGNNVADYIALSGNLEMAQWVLQQKPDLFNKMNHGDVTFLLNVAQSGNVEMLQWAQLQFPQAFDKFSPDILHYAAMSGNPQAVYYVLQGYKRSISDFEVRRLVKKAIASSSVDLLRWLLDNYPGIFADPSNISGPTIAEQTAKSGNPDMFQLLFERKPDLINSRKSLASWATLSNNPEMLDVLAKSNYKFLEQRDPYSGRSLPHYAAQSSNPLVFQWVVDNKPHLLEKKDIDKRNAAHYAAQYGNTKILQLIFEHKPQLLQQRDVKGFTIAHYAAEAGNVNTLEWVIEHAPNLMSKESGQQPAILSEVARSANPYVVKQRLAVAIKRVLENEVQKIDLEWLRLFPDECKTFLVSSSSEDARRLIENQSRFPEAIQQYIHLPIFKAKTFSFKEGLLTTSQLQLLLDNIKACQSTPQDSHPFINALAAFVKQCRDESLNESEIKCLLVLVEDNERGMFGPSNSLSYLLQTALLQSSTLSQLRPKREVTRGLAITPDNYRTYAATFRERVLQLPLNENEKSIMQEIMLPGLETLIQKPDEIVEFAITNYGQLYYLDANEKLPLHTNHTPVLDAEAYRKTLHRLIENFYGAADRFFQAGRLMQFCGQICQGFCFEGRVRDSLELAASLFDVVSFEELMEKYIEEYRSYNQVMLSLNEKSSFFLEPVLDFILKRHQHQPCLKDEEFAPNCEVTKHGLKHYLTERFDLESNKNLEAIDKLVLLLVKESNRFWSSSSAVKEQKIKALKELRQTMVTFDPRDPIERFVATIVKKYPLAFAGSDSRTKKLFETIIFEIHESQKDIVKPYRFTETVAFSSVVAELKNRKKDDSDNEDSNIPQVKG